MSFKSRLVLRFSIVLVVSAGILFLPAGTWRYWQGWTCLAVVFTFAIFAFSYFYRADREFLERRLRSKEKISEQKRLMQVLKPFFFVVFLFPGLDYRYGWTRIRLGPVPAWLSLVSDAVILGGFLIIFWVGKVNRFASRTIEVEAGQPVVSSGPYGLIRHPMYAGSLVIFLSLPLALGSYIAWPAFALLIPFYVYRLLNEEKFLHKELSGYREYCLRTRFRLIPFVW